LLAESLFSADQKHSRIAEAVAEADRSVSLIAPLSNADSPVEPYRAAALYHFIQGLARENGRPVPGRLEIRRRKRITGPHCVSWTAPSL